MDPDFYTKRTQKLLLSGYSLELFTFDSTVPDAPIVHWHWHDEIEFQYVLKGHAYITCNEKIYMYLKGILSSSIKASDILSRPPKTAGEFFIVLLFILPLFLDTVSLNWKANISIL